MSRISHYPPSHKSLRDKSFYPEATHKIKFTETHNSYFFKTGETVYKFYKEHHDHENLAIREALYREELRLGHIFSEGLYLDVVELSEDEGRGFHWGPGEKVIDYAIKMKQLNERYLLSAWLEREKVAPIMISRLATHVAEAHLNSVATEEAPHLGRPEHFSTLCQELFYQPKKYLDLSVIQPMLDIIKRPLEKFTESHRKLFLKRIKKQRIIHGHGALHPDHIYIRGKEIYLLSPRESHRQFWTLDVAGDVASLTVEFARLNQQTWSDLWIKRYVSAAKDRDLLKLLPAYQTFVALKQGIHFAEWMFDASEEERSELLQRAMDYFHLAVRFSREIPKL